MKKYQIWTSNTDNIEPVLRTFTGSELGAREFARGYIDAKHYEDQLRQAVVKEEINGKWEIVSRAVSMGAV